jgi:hypothetical protein
VTAVLNLDPAEVESISAADIGDFETLADFEARFRSFDLPSFMTEHGIATVDELRRAYRYLLGEIRLAAPPPFDAGSPANRRRFPLDVAVLLRDDVDLAGSLRWARRVRDLADHGRPQPADVVGIEVRTSWAPLLVFSPAAVSASGIPEDELTGFFAAQEVLALSLAA